MKKIRINGISQINFYRLMILLTGIVLFVPFLGHVALFDWDEINFAECAREMITSNDYLNVKIDYTAFWEKPPLFIWFQVASMKIFGINEFAARFPNAICGIVSLLVLFEIGRKTYSTRFGIYWVLMYIASFLPFFYFKSGIIDPWFNLFIFLSVYQLIIYFRETKLLPVVLSALFAGLAVLTKGPAAVILIGLSLLVFILIKKFRVKFKFWHLPLYIVVFAFTGGFWFILQIFNGNTDLMYDFIQYQIRLFTTEDAGHGGFFLYHFVIIFFGASPASVLALPSLFSKNKKDLEKQKDFGLWMKILFWVVLIVFTIVKTKIVHYSSLTYFPLTFLAARTLFLIDFNHARFGRWKKILLAINFSILCIAVAALPFFDKFKFNIIKTGWIKDDFAIGNLMATADWSYSVTFISLLSLVSLFLILYYIRFHSDIYKIFAFSLIYTLFNYYIVFEITPEIEKYSQKAAIEFISEQNNKNVYVYPLGHKSYAHLFYSHKPDFENAMQWNEEVFMNGKANRDTYVLIKVNKAKEYFDKYPMLEYLYSKNGFVFGKVKSLTNGQ